MIGLQSTTCGINLSIDNITTPTVLPSFEVLMSCNRFVFVIEGEIQVSVDGKTVKLAADHWAYLPPGTTEGCVHQHCSITSAYVICFLLSQSRLLADTSLPPSKLTSPSVS